MLLVAAQAKIGLLHLGEKLSLADGGSGTVATWKVALARLSVLKTVMTVTPLWGFDSLTFRFR